VERARARIRISFKEARDLFRAYIGNLGSGGLFIKTARILPVGTLLDLEFNLPKRDQIVHTKAKVAWARSQDMSTEKLPPGMGAEFIDMNPEDRELLKNYIAALRSS